MLSTASSALHRGVLLGVLLAAWTAGAEQELPVYPGAVHTRIGQDLVISGEYYRLAYFTTDDTMEKVAGYFEKHWRGLGYPTVVEGDLREEAVVSALYTREGLQRGVVLRKHLGKTVGFSVLRDLWVRAPRKEAPGLVKLEGTLFSQDITTRDDPGGSQSRSSLVKGELEAVRRQVSEGLAQQGFSLVRQTGGKLGGEQRFTLEHARKGQQVVTTLSPVDAGTTAILQMWMGSDRPDAVPNDDAVRQSREAWERQQKAAQARPGSPP
ncbi:hypothetical protein POL68_10070 [Stigmatella sp. ncwal1]|uniref:Uncharacterized protein n=1 Tax=Stigmatella ashevillensis TaxID=2995309 RepID=A0ABT5D7J0_9BACT|nr:hypothetical protein [Stigmatella ashevillena]MDC0708813.1 hypothetical protein [Stigmatella ashevillena]